MTLGGARQMNEAATSLRTGADAIRTPVLDEALYSRQLYVLGHEAMFKMQNANVLVLGLRGLGLEIAKNLILAGVKSVCVLDDILVSADDLGAGFYFGQKDIGNRSRSAACVDQLTTLNPYVHVEAISDFPDVDAAMLRMRGISTLVVTEKTIDEQLRLNSICRKCSVKFVAADVRGISASLFVDFGDQFLVIDSDGEPPLSGIVSSVSQDESGVVTVYDESRHGLSDGDLVTFDEIEGMTELNDSEPRPIKVLGPYTFSIEDTRSYGAYSHGGRFRQVKAPRTISFKRLDESIREPSILHCDYGKIGRSMELHVMFQAISNFQNSHNGLLPAPHLIDHAREIARNAADIGSRAHGIEVDQEWVARVARCAGAHLAPMAAVLGGIAAQEVLKACTGKFTPLQQHLYFDAIECLPDSINLDDLKNFAPRGSRYDSQIAVIGADLHARLSNAKTFLVGAGAIGCEMLKNWAMMGVGTESGQIVVTDMDAIETSNLNRQFLFRPRDVGNMKSETAAAASLVMNPDLNIEAHSNRVGPETEIVYDDEFWDTRDFICTALDNVDARLYVDQQCVFYRKPMLESGTLGTKGNTQVIVPRLTESYGSSRDPPEQGVPVCTLHNFPNKAEHTIQWARDYFLEGFFKKAIDDVNNYLGVSGYLDELAKEPNQELSILRTLKTYLCDDRPMSFENCIVWARLRFEEQFSHNIKQLLHNFPVDSTTSSGALFWSGPKRAPTPLQFDPDDEIHMRFVIACANLRAFNYGLQGSTDEAQFRNVLKTVMVPEFRPKEGVKIAASDEEMKDGGDAVASDEVETSKLKAALPPPSTMAGYRLHAVDFEKDDDTNFHMDFVEACANLRSANYRIKQVSRHEAKRIAGNIIPAIATTTAMVTGLICLELYKLLQGKPLEAYRNCFASLALPLFSFAEPVPPAVITTSIKGEEFKYSLWDSIDLDIGDVTLQQLLDHLQASYGIDVDMMSFGSSLIFSSFGNAATQAQRLKLPVSQVVQSVSNKKLLPKQRYIILEVCATDMNDGQDIEIPSIRFKLSPRSP